MINSLVNSIGRFGLKICQNIGNFVIFLFTTFSILITTRLKTKQVIIQIKRIGVESFTINFLTGLASGFALALQTYIGLQRFGGQELLGVVVAMGMIREVGPVFTGIIVTGRAGSSMAAEIATMVITEQIDALKTLCINPYQYLIVPRIVASILVLPFLTCMSMLCGIVGGYIYSTKVLEVDSETYITNMRINVELSDIIGGLVKAAFFGLILAWVGCYMGFVAHGGAQGVGKATTKSVVIGTIMILIANYFLSSLLFQLGVA